MTGSESEVWDQTRDLQASTQNTKHRAAGSNPLGMVVVVVMAVSLNLLLRGKKREVFVVIFSQKGLFRE